MELDTGASLTIMSENTLKREITAIYCHTENLLW